MSEVRYPMEEVEAALDVADIAAELVALWGNRKMKPAREVIGAYRGLVSCGRFGYSRS